jgi:peptidoglycan/LPS O-acetylase OafA/YrhL
VEYRRDIDGLRAVAVGTVVIFHAFPLALPGGYIGVDVFFVISGYLITSIIHREIQENRFSIRKFYERRFRRIIPALMFAITLTTIAGWIVLSPPDFTEYGESLVATSAFMSNIYFWLTGGYFSGPAHEKALLHTWSLAVEEQFYVIWPIVLIALAKVPRKWFVTAFAAIFLGSLFLAEFRLSEQPLEVFFGFHTRAWELLVGAAIAVGLVPMLKGRRIADFLVLMGLALIIGSALLLQPESRFPGIAALPACIGTLLVIQYGADSQTASILRLRPVVFIGLISYSLYLWHWPVLVLGRLSLEQPPSTGQTFLMLVVAVIGAVVSWRFVERPFRRPSPERLPLSSFAPPIGALALAGAAGGFLLLTDGAEFRAPPQSLRYASVGDDFNPRRAACLTDQYSGHVAPLDGCTFGGEPISIVVWGDSHADAITPGVEEWAVRQGLGGRQITKSACPPLLGVTLATLAGPRLGCARANLETLKAIEMTQPAIVFLAARWSRYVEASPSQEGGEFFLTDADPLTDRAGNRQSFSTALDETVARIKGVAPETRVVILGPLPEWNANPVRCAVRKAFRGNVADGCFERPSTEFEAHTRVVENSIRATVATSRAAAVWPEDVLCDASVCRAAIGGELLYRDDDHLSAMGAKILVRRLLD